MKKPEFEQFRRSVIRAGKALPQQDREPYRQGAVSLIEDTGLMLVQKARKDGHDEALMEIHGSWVGTDFSPEGVQAALREHWPGSLFPHGEEQHWIDIEDEVVTLDFACKMDQGFLTGRVRITV